MIKNWIDYLVIKRSDYFDPAYYLYQYQDCRIADVDPLMHYIKLGWREKRNPSSRFDTAYYLRTNPDVVNSGVNPLVHYLQHGRQEGRKATPYTTTQSIVRRGKRMGRVRGSIYMLGKNVYWRIPAKTRQRILTSVYKVFGFLLGGMPHYDNWRSAQSAKRIYNQAHLIDMKMVEPWEGQVGKIAVHLHMFYPDLAEEFASYLQNMPYSYDLYVSVTDAAGADQCQRAMARLPNCQSLVIEIVPNRGRDMAPLLVTFADRLAAYDYVAHLHSKKSLHNKGATTGWREYLCEQLLGSPEQIRKIFTLLQGEEPCSIVYPQNYILVPYWANTWLANRAQGQAWCQRLGITDMPKGYFHYSAGSMFWIRKEAIAPIYEAGIRLEDFVEEQGQTDSTLAHVMERLFVLNAMQQGHSPGIIKDEGYPSWSAWRFDQYVNRTYARMVLLLKEAKYKLIAFDVFDTLLSRPLMDPESVKRIISRRLGGETGELYSSYRAVAEQKAREEKGEDVGLDEIYGALGDLAGLTAAQSAEIMTLEMNVESALLAPRADVVDLLLDAAKTLKPVVLISDMFLPRELLEDVLSRYEIGGWSSFFLSNEIGLRKDAGQLYDYVLEYYGLNPEDLLMVGDNERSDVQIPIDMSAGALHLHRPLELARGMPRFSNLIAQHEYREDLDAEITLGFVLRKNFSPIHFPDFDSESLIHASPLNWGYSLLGPLMVSFADWLYRQAREDGVERLYFLSREGKPIKEIYDCWVDGLVDGPDSRYFVISRRAAGLAAISSLDDVLHIARTRFYPNTLESFLLTRYGLSLSETRWAELKHSLDIDRASEIEVEERKIDSLIPVLKALEPDIYARVEIERAHLMQYFQDQDLMLDNAQAVVDIGYGGSVQGYINQLIPQKMHGYYMMTDDRATGNAEKHDVLLRGCFYENIHISSNAPEMMRNSFDLEKLLSTNEPQLEYYQRDGQGVTGHFREMLPEELTSREIRDQLLEGALAYARDARRLREDVLPDFQPSIWTTQQLFDAFLVQKSDKETDLLSEIVLDDYYCGRDLVF